ncbi:MAG TPA: GxxExxY protein [Tepidisphaeraceae bacterium]|nr:GxxExxY protein [Tepidisphaeraceae bacterium]
MTDAELNRLTERIIGCAYRVGSALGYGYLEKVYENAMMVALTREGLRARQQFAIDVRFDGVVVGHFTADLLVEDTVLIELKSAKDLDESHVAQCVNYLHATGLTICLLINFGPSVKVRRLRN